jgi:hypothetical protein
MHKTFVLKVCVRVSDDLQDFDTPESAENVLRNQLLITNLFDMVTTEWQGFIKVEKNGLELGNA